MNPRARSGVIARPVGGEVVVYDPATHAAHCLNRTAALVFRAADGRMSLAGLAESLARETGGEAREDLVWASLERLAAANLLEGPLPPRPADPSRRQALRSMGLGLAVLAPVVASLVVPTPAEAAATCVQATSCSSSNFGQSCYVLSPAECASKICTGTPGDCQ